MEFNLNTIDWTSIAATAGILTTILGTLIAGILRVSKRQRESLQAFDAYRKEILEFANSVIDTMSRAEGLVSTDPNKSRDDVSTAQQQFVEYRRYLLCELSAQIERGRFFFPNREVSNIGSAKGSANRGLRDRVLNRIMSAHYAILAVDYINYEVNFENLDFNSVIGWKNEQGRRRNLYNSFAHLSKEEQSRLQGEYRKRDRIRLRDLIVSAKRSFVSEIFSIVQPRDWLKRVEESYGVQLQSRCAETPGVKVEKEI